MNQHTSVLSPEVSRALSARGPIVALESTVITHGLAYPQNLAVARGMEQSIAAASATPATIAIIAGRACVGLDSAQMEHLASTKGIRKCSMRDLGIAVGRNFDGGTTVAATMWLAHKAGISVFATGGIGGVHRGHPFDISADLTELSRTPVTVVCAGAKALLDLPLTFEHLETLGVPIIGWRTDEIPAFYSRKSGLSTDYSAESADEVIDIILARRQLGLPGGELVCVPVPVEHELPADTANHAIELAQHQADVQNIHGAASTPFMLAEIARLTNGASVTANSALLIQNASVAAQIAVALAKRLRAAQS